jgi:hypothetical protein
MSAKRKPLKDYVREYVEQRMQYLERQEQDVGICAGGRRWNQL